LVGTLRGKRGGSSTEGRGKSVDQSHKTCGVCGKKGRRKRISWCRRVTQDRESTGIQRKEIFASLHDQRRVCGKATLSVLSGIRGADIVEKANSKTSRGAGSRCRDTRRSGLGRQGACVNLGVGVPSRKGMTLVKKKEA